MTLSFVNLKKNIPLPTNPLSIEVKYKAKSSYPLIPSKSPEGIIGTLIEPPTYSEEQNGTWALMYNTHEKNIEHGLCDEYLLGREKLNFPKNKVPFLKETNVSLNKHSDWEVIRVEGLVPADKFFALLANKKFPCTDFIRHRDEIEYTPAPDTFHDQMGHLPMITLKEFADFFHAFGLAGASATTDEEIMWFNRIYWFTVEFGLINPTAHLGIKRDSSLTKIYGAGIASSVGEITYSLSDKVTKKPFNIDSVIKTEFDIHHMQDLLFEITSFADLEKEFIEWAQSKKFL